MVDFEYYLKTERKLGQVTVNKAIQRFKKPVSIAVAEGYLEKDSFTLHQFKRVKKEIVFLSSEELTALENHIFTQPKLQLVKDLSVFSSYTGLAYNELANLMSSKKTENFWLFPQINSKYFIWDEPIRQLAY